MLREQDKIEVCERLSFDPPPEARLLPSRTRCYWWRVVASNGQVLLTSEMYSRLLGAQRSARTFAKRHDLTSFVLVPRCKA